MATYCHHGQDIGHGHLHGLGKVEGERDVDGQLAHVKEGRREGRREETQLVLEEADTETDRARHTGIKKDWGVTTSRH